MPPRKKPDAEPSDAAADLCPEHFPPTWDDLPENYASVGCEHGTFVRPGADEDETNA